MFFTLCQDAHTNVGLFYFDFVETDQGKVVGKCVKWKENAKKNSVTQIILQLIYIVIQKRLIMKHPMHEDNAELQSSFLPAAVRLYHQNSSQQTQ